MSKVSAADIIGGIAAAKSFISPTAAPSASGKLSNFIAEIRSSGIARSNLFEVEIAAPRILAGNPTTAIIPLYGCDASLPGAYLQTLDNKRFGIGPNEKLPYSVQYNDIGLSFIGDGQGSLYKFFYRWIHGTVRGDAHIISNDVSAAGLSPYEVEFKENYRTSVVIRTFDEQQKKILEYHLMEAYPIWLGEIPLSWSGSDDLQKFPVAFTYLQARLTTVDEERTRNKNGQRELTPFEKLYKLGTAGQTIFASRKPRSVGDIINVVSNAKIIIDGMKGTF
jgi:hypothetical protein